MAISLLDNLSIEKRIPEALQEAFLVTWKGYPALHEHPITLKYSSMKAMTMRAQPLLNVNFFSKVKRSYKIEVQPRPEFDRSLKLENLKQNVLIGWFAHELGHIMDYRDRHWSSLIKMGMAYALLPTFRIGVERKADIYAIENGFAEYIQATKHFILKESNIPDKYLSRINKYYLTPHEVEQIILGRDGDQSARRDSII